MKETNTYFGFEPVSASEKTQKVGAVFSRWQKNMI